MFDCECRFVPPVEAHSFTGRTNSQIICDVTSQLDLKHWVVVTNNRGHAVEIYVSARIIAPHLVRFSDCPDFDLPANGHIQDHFWHSEVTLAEKQRFEFGVYLSADNQKGEEQRIDIEIATKDPHASFDQQYTNSFKVIA